LFPARTGLHDKEFPLGLEPVLGVASGFETASFRFTVSAQRDRIAQRRAVSRPEIRSIIGRQRIVNARSAIGAGLVVSQPDQLMHPSLMLRDLFPRFGFGSCRRVPGSLKSRRNRCVRLGLRLNLNHFRQAQTVHLVLLVCSHQHVLLGSGGRTYTIGATEYAPFGRNPPRNP
jgi:hypothetical protein